MFGSHFFAMAKIVFKIIAVVFQNIKCLILDSVVIHLIPEAGSRDILFYFFMHFSTDLRRLRR